LAILHRARKDGRIAWVLGLGHVITGVLVPSPHTLCVPLARQLSVLDSIRVEGRIRLILFGWLGMLCLAWDKLVLVWQRMLGRLRYAHWMTGVTGGRIKPKHCEMKDHFAHSCLTTAGSLEAIPHPGHRMWVGAQSWWMETAKVPQPSMSKRRVGYRNSNDEEWWGRNAGGKPRDGEGYVNGRLQCRPAAGG